MIRIPYDNKDYYLPESFNELSADQLINFAGLVGDKDKDDHSLRVLHLLLGVSLYEFFRIPLDAKERMLPFIKWAFEENTLTLQRLPSYKGYYGPKSEFDNLTLGEFHYTETYYRQLATGDESAADKLIAVLYRLPVKDYNQELDSAGDIRQPFNPHEIEYYERFIKAWPLNIKAAIVMWYDGCRQHLVSLYDKVFAASDAPDPDASEYGMYGVIRNLSGDKFGKITEVEKIYVNHAFVEIEKIIEDNERIEAEMKKTRV